MKQSTGKTGPILAVLIAGVLMGALDIAILSPALRFIQADFGIDERALSWIISSYVILSLVGTPIMARLADLFGKRRVFMLDIVLFASGSLLVVLSGWMHAWWLLLLGRSIQGFGGGGIFPVATATIGDVVAPEKRGAFLGALGAVFGLAFIVGPIVGGILIPYGWHWLFLINAPIAALILVFAARILPTGEGRAGKSMDLPGIAFLSVFLVSLSLAVNGIDTSLGLAGLAANGVPLWALAALAFLALTIFAESRTDHPLLPGRLFKGRKLRLAWALAAATGFAESSLAFIPTLALAAHGGSGLSASTAAYLLLPLVVAMSLMSPLAGRALDRFGARAVMLSGSLVMTVGFVGLALLYKNLGLLIASSVLVGAGIAALLGAPLRFLVLAESREEDRTIAQGLANMATSVGMAVGAAAIGAFAASGAAAVSGEVAVSAAATAGRAPAAAAGYGAAFALVAAAGAAAFCLALALGDGKKSGLGGGPSGETGAGSAGATAAVAGAAGTGTAGAGQAEDGARRS